MSPASATAGIGAGVLVGELGGGPVAAIAAMVVVALVLELVARRRA